MSMTKLLSRFSLMLTLLVGLVAFTLNPLYAQETDSCEAGFRLFTHAMGENCIPENPQRVVVLDTGELDNALALGAPVVGAPVSDALQYQAYLSDQLEGISDTGTISEPNFEAILALAPDLILGSKQRYEAIYEQLTQIAPTVLTASLRVPWQDNFRLHADALGKTAEAEQLFADYQDHVAQLQDALGDALDSTTISIIRFRPGQVRLYLKSSYIGYILQDVGLRRPPSQDEDVFSSEISIEQMQDVDADYIFVTGYDVEDSERDAYLNSPLWQTLSAVQAGHVVDINDDTWIAGLGVQAANLVLDDLQQLLAPQDEVSAAFPVTVLHKFGSTTIAEAPERVVAIGFNDQDALLALGVTPLAARYWYGDETDAIFPWAEDKTDGTQPVVLNMPFGSLNYEAIIALDPDLIVAVYSGITQEEFDLLSQIAPTIAQSADYTDFGMPWQEATLLIGAALGKAAEAETLVSSVEALITAAREENPQFAGKTIAVVYGYETGLYGYYTAQDPRARFFTDLGFVVPDELVEIAGDSYYADVSAERIDLLDQDLIVFVGLQFIEGGRAAVEADPLFNQLQAVQDGRVIYVPNDYDDALQFSTVLSLPYALEGVLPDLEAIVSGD